MNSPSRLILLMLLLFGLSLRAHATNTIPDFGAAQTVITSDQLEMENREHSNHFFFKGKVRVIGNNMEATCDEMEVITSRSSEDKSNGSEAETPDNTFGSIEKIIAIGQVNITQTGRRATADRAEIHPSKEYLELIGNVTLENENGTVSGPRFILEKGERARMVGDGGDTRPTVTLPGLPDLGVSEKDLLRKKDKEEEEEEEESTRSGKR